ncbi:hypothetical protein AX769_01000 [Frondihabitans sp. PAMC 28766]|uniref:hypothetical protein n=1 Tax=Frondihabitans sp. PAMC 28766 TaxID=1795630 RepID=UPI00078C78A8|nr:hypothetical protein [Frondihabitans sp. PAMC 28766]AMM18975.1 hypothetical protein AX769_01000 [Frondihabitans sp. PAMC 28766]
MSGILPPAVGSGPVGTSAPTGTATDLISEAAAGTSATSSVGASFGADRVQNVPLETLTGTTGAPAGSAPVTPGQPAPAPTAPTPAAPLGGSGSATGGGNGGNGGSGSAFTTLASDTFARPALLQVSTGAGTRVIVPTAPTFDSDTTPD